MTYLVFKINHIAPYHHYIFLNVLLWYLGFQLFIRFSTTIYLIKKIFTSKEYLIIIQPFHPDNCSGLKPIGDISILVNLIIFLIGLGFSLHLSVIIIFQNGSLLEEPINILGLTLYFIISPLTFWSMIGMAHKKMKGKKQKLLNELKQELHKNYTILFNSLNKDSFIDEKVYDNLLKINTLYTHTKKLTVLPFKIETVRNFLGAFFSLLCYQ